MGCCPCTNRRKSSCVSHLHVRTNKSWGLNKPVGFLAPFFQRRRFCGSRLRHLGVKFCIAPPQSDTRNLSNAADAHVTGCEGLIPARRRRLSSSSVSLRGRGSIRFTSGCIASLIPDMLPLKRWLWKRKETKNQESWASLCWNSDRDDKDEQAAARISSLVVW